MLLLITFALHVQVAVNLLCTIMVQELYRHCKRAQVTVLVFELLCNFPAGVVVS